MALACAHNACAAVTRGGAVFAWGSNSYGELGQPDFALETHNAVRVPLPDAPVRMLAAGLWHQIAVLEDGRACAWGRNEHGQLGRAASTNLGGSYMAIGRGVFGGESVLMAACGNKHTLFVGCRGSLYACGQNSSGQLGLGDELPRSGVTRVDSGSFVGARVAFAACGSCFSVVLTHNADVYTWGAGVAGCLGHGNEIPRAKPCAMQPHAFAGARIVHLAAGDEHSVATSTNGELWSWGDNSAGQLGLGHFAPALVPTALRARCLGGHGARVVACGGDHTLFVSTAGELYVCGGSWNSTLGGLHNVHMASPSAVPRSSFDGKPVATAAATYGHSAVLTADGKLYSWGRGLLTHEQAHLHQHTDLGAWDWWVHPLVRRVSQQVLAGCSAGRYLPLPPELVLAVLMSQHARLGAWSPLRGITVEVLREHVLFARMAPQSRGLRTLLAQAQHGGDSE
jgi:alpha-tubulin suppressor-like RCC1 family protein